MKIIKSCQSLVQIKLIEIKIEVKIENQNEKGKLADG